VFILDINKVEVTPSREAVKWSAKTRAAVIDSYNKIVETATLLVNTELDSTKDYLEWLQKVSSVKSSLSNNNNDGNNSVIQKLSGVIDASTITKIYYRKNGLNKLYTSNVKDVIGDKLLLRIFTYDSYAKKIIRKKVKIISNLHLFSIYVTTGASDKYKDRYIFELLKKTSFIVLKKLESWEDDIESNLIGNSSILKDYDAVVVPEIIKDGYIQEELDGYVIEDEEEGSTSTAVVDANYRAKLRKLEEKILLHKALRGYSDITYPSHEVKIKDILMGYMDETIIYGSFSNRNLINNILSLCPSSIFTNIDPYSGNDSYFGDSFKPKMVELLKNKNISIINAILISKDNVKHVQNLSNFEHVSDFVVESYKDGKLVINKVIRLVLTFHVIKKLLTKYNISYREHNIHKEAYEVTKFITPEFITIMGLMNHFPDNHTILPMFQSGINYELGKKSLDESTLADYMTELNDNLPDELCEKIDDIMDIHIIDTILIQKVEDYCRVYEKYFTIIDSFSNYGAENAYKLLHKLANKYEEFPKELGYFQ